MGLLQTVRAGAERCGDHFVRPEGVHAVKAEVMGVVLYACAT